MLRSIIKHHQELPGTPIGERRQRIFQFLCENPIGTLSTVSPDGMPHGTVICFDIAYDMQLTFISKIESTKVFNIAHNKHVSLSIYDAKTQTTCHLDGIAKQIASSTLASHSPTYQSLKNRLQNGQIFAALAKLTSSSDYTVVTIDPLQIRMARFANPHPGSYGALFESIESFDLMPSPLHRNA